MKQYYWVESQQLKQHGIWLRQFVKQRVIEFEDGS